MDIAVVLSGHRHGTRGPDLMLRPFAHASLLELALEKLQGLDAPCRKYVACADREIRELASQHPDLNPIRASHLLNWVTPKNAATDLSHLRNLPESWFLVVNPAYPFVDADLWWQVIEDFLSSDSNGIVSAESVSGPFFSPEGQPHSSIDYLFAQNDAFMLVPRESLEDSAEPESGSLSPYILAPEAICRADEVADIAALEAVHNQSRLGLTI